MKRRRLKAVEITLAKTAAVADRVATDLPGNVVAFTMEIDNPEYRVEQNLHLSDEEIQQDRKQNSAYSERDILASHRKRGHIDKNQYEAGREWQGHCQRAGTVSINSVDFRREAVDGGKIKDPMQDAQMNSVAELKRAGKALGTRYNELIWLALGMDEPLIEIARLWGWESRVVGAMFKDALDILSIVFGLASPHMEHSMNKYLT